MSEESRARSTWAVLRDRNVAPYFVGNLSSNMGTYVQTVAQSILVYRLTGSSLFVGIVNFAQFAGAFVLAPWAGAAADRFDRRRLLTATQLTAAGVALVLAVLTWTGHTTTITLMVAALVIGMAIAFATPALQAVVPGLVPAHDVPAAVSVTAITFNLARATGPVVGAGVVAAVGFGWAFFLNALSFLLLVAALQMISMETAQGRTAGPQRFWQGVSLLRDRPDVVVALGAIAVISVSSDPVNTLAPEFGATVYGLGETFAGPLMGAFGAGAVTAALANRWATDRGMSLAITTSLLGTGMVGFGFSPTWWVGMAGLWVAGAGFVWSVTIATSAIHAAVPDNLRGRVMALWTIAFLGSRPFASLLDGALAAAVGPRPAAVAFAVPALVAGVVLWRRGR